MSVNEMYSIIEITGTISESENNRKERKKERKKIYNFHKKVFEFRFQFRNRF